jgi:hypothetical protein
MTSPGTQFEAIKWMGNLPEKELYDIYAHTVEQRFPAFGVRSFDDCRYDLVQPLHTYNDDVPVNQEIVDIIVTPESHERFTDSLDEYTKKYGVQSWLNYEGSVLWLTDHGQFTDVPVLAESLGRIGLGERQKTVQVVSEMISVMDLDIGQGPFHVVNKLQDISAVVQTVPRLEGSPSQKLEDYRERTNESGLTVLEAVRDTPGTSTVLSVIGRHNQKSKLGNTLYVHEPNKRTLETYFASHVKVVLVCIDCPTFKEGGAIEPADMKFVFYPPMHITNPKKDTKDITMMIRDATNQMVGANYKHGVKVRSWKAQNATRAAKSFRQKITQQIVDTDTDY